MTNKNKQEIKNPYYANLLKIKDRFIDFRHGGFELIRDFGETYERIGYIYHQAEAIKIEYALNSHERLTKENEELRALIKDIKYSLSNPCCSQNDGSIESVDIVESIRDLIDVQLTKSGE